MLSSQELWGEMLAAQSYGTPKVYSIQFALYMAFDMQRQLSDFAGGRRKHQSKHNLCRLKQQWLCLGIVMTHVEATFMQPSQDMGLPRGLASALDAPDLYFNIVSSFCVLSLHVSHHSITQPATQNDIA